MPSRNTTGFKAATWYTATRGPFTRYSDCFVFFLTYFDIKNRHQANLNVPFIVLQYFTSPLGRRLTDEELERYSPMIMDTVKRGKKSLDKKSLDKNSTTQPNKISTQKLKELIQSGLVTNLETRKSISLYQ